MSRWDTLLRDLRRARAGYVLTGGSALVGSRGDAQMADIQVSASGLIERVGEPGAISSDALSIDVSGLAVTPGFVDAHQHLDKTGSLEVASNPSGTLQGARRRLSPPSPGA